MEAPKQYRLLPPLLLAHRNLIVIPYAEDTADSVNRALTVAGPQDLSFLLAGFCGNRGCWEAAGGWKSPTVLLSCAMGARREAGMTPGWPSALPRRKCMPRAVNLLKDPWLEIAGPRSEARWT